MGDELVALFGFSGSGKTMTLQMIAGLLRPDEGYIQVNGKRYFDSTTGLDVKTKSRRRAGRVREMIDLFRLDGLEKSFPHQISGGQKQRVALARALIGKPELLMLDEPFSALDRPIREKMQDVIKEIRSEFSIPVVLVTHDYSEVQKMADKVIVYSDGKVVQIGSPAEIRKNPSGDRVNELLGIG
ncbi:MAG: sulfate/molybdate ABC transporter ATP-binding protein [Thermoleophilia bacterium]